jgi:hypothetical protein
VISDQMPEMMGPISGPGPPDFTHQVASGSLATRDATR